MKKANGKKLALRIETVRNLGRAQLDQVAGGALTYTVDTTTVDTKHRHTQHGHNCASSACVPAPQTTYVTC
jgi:hypothetical protein